MVPTFAGRIQTRLFTLAVIGSLLTLLITPLLPLSGSLTHRYQTTFSLLAAVAFLGVGWELIYHGLQQFRWEKDWPTSFGLITGINEGVVVFLLSWSAAVPFLPPVAPIPFLVDFTVVWIGVWLFVNGPMRVPFLHWRFLGGRVL